MRSIRVLTYALVIFAAAWSLWPIYSIIRPSFMLAPELSARPMHFLPQEPSLTPYMRMLGYTVEVYGEVKMPQGIWRDYVYGLLNSLIVASVGTLLAMVFAVLGGYAFARYRFRLKNGLLGALLMSRALPPVAIMIPYLMFYRTLNLIGNLWGLMLTYLAMTVPLVTWVLMGFFATLPIDLEKAARVDGCSRLSALFRVVVPMSLPGIVACGAIGWLMMWNEFILALTLVGGSSAATYPTVLQGAFTGGTYPSIDLVSNYSAGAVMGLIPPLALGILFQKYITQLKIVDPLIIQT